MFLLEPFPFIPLLQAPGRLLGQLLAQPHLHCPIFWMCPRVAFAPHQRVAATWAPGPSLEEEDAPCGIS